MTKDEKIVELLRKYEEKSPKIDLDLYKDEQWGMVTIECSDESELTALKQRVFNFVAGWIDKSLNRTGVFEMLLCVPYKSEFDSSEAACVRRAEINELQNNKMEEIRKGIADIEAEYATESEPVESTNAIN